MHKTSYHGNIQSFCSVGFNANPLTWYPVKNEDCGAGKLGVDVKCRFCTRGWLGQDG